MVGEHVGYVVRDEYAVFKIDNFHEGIDFEQIRQGWNDLTNSSV